jgi:hypothetical protein
VTILEMSPVHPGPAVSGISRMARRRPLVESLRLVARLHVDLQRLSSAICLF